MDLFSGNISHMIFEASINPDLGKISLSKVMLGVLSALDGSRDVAAVSRLLNIHMTDLRKILRKLYDHKLIIRSEQASPVLNGDFISHLQSQLAEVMGPIAHMLIKDAMTRMAVSPTSVPVNRVAELIDLISINIPIDDKKRAFRESMLTRVTT
jgi:hypothetical protein